MMGDEDILRRAQDERAGYSQPVENVTKSPAYEDAIYAAKLAFMDTQNPHLSAEARCDRWDDFIEHSLALMETLYPDDADLQKEIELMRKAVTAVPRPRITFESMKFNDAYVMELSSEAGQGARDRPSEARASEFYHNATEREYKVTLQQIRRYGMIVAAEMVKRKLLPLENPDEDMIVPTLPSPQEYRRKHPRAPMPPPARGVP